MLLNQDVDPKQPEETATYVGDWRRFLAAIGSVTIASSAWAVVGGDGMLAIAGSAIGPDLKQTSVTLSSGTAGQVYTLRNTVTLSDGQVRRRYGVLEVVDEATLLRT